MRRSSAVFLTICFLAFLGLTMAFTVLREPAASSYWENRMLTQFPDWSAESVGNGSYAAGVETYLEDHAALRTTMLKWKTGIDLALRRPVVNDVVLTPDRLFPYLPFAPMDADEVDRQAQAMADNLRRISDSVERYGGYYCYVAVPCQYAYFQEDYPWYLYNRRDLSQRSVDSLSRALEASGVNFLDLGAAYGEMGRPEQFGSNVDNHYTMQGAFAAYQSILEKVAKETQLEFPILREEDVIFETLPGSYMGSRERKLFNLAQREEQLSILLPKEAVPFTRQDSGVSSLPEVYVFPQDGGELTYSLYMGGDLAQTLLDTHRDALPSVLLYGDSFTNAMECVLYLSFDQMYSLDLRHYHEESLEDFISRIQPEVVICLRDYEALTYAGGNGGGV